MSQAAFGFWKVTTQGDCEGRTTRNLGVHLGWVDEIAFALAGSACYDLCFEAVDPEALPKNSTAKQVSISFANTYSMKRDQRLAHAAEILADRPCRLAIDNYGNIGLSRGESSAEIEAAKRVAAKNRLQKKLENLLSTEELELLGDMDA